MINFEEDILPSVLPLSEGDFSVCFDEDREMADHINKALSALDTRDVSFFDLDISEAEREALNLIEIKTFNNWGLFDYEINYLPELSENFIRNFALSKANAECAPIIANVITKIVRTVISELSYDSCKVTLRTYPSDINHTALHWHIDKRHEETLGLEMDNTLLQTNFFFTLKGANTLFYPVSHEFRADWNKAAEELAFAYGGEPVQSMIPNKSNVISAEPYQGSIHKAGKAHGTIHARPFPGDGRMMLLITPGNQSIIQTLGAFESYHLHASSHSAANT